MNAQTEPFSGRLLNDVELDHVLSTISWTPNRLERIETHRGTFAVWRAGDRVILKRPDGRRFVLKLAAHVPYSGGWPLTEADIEGAWLLPPIVEDAPRRLRPEGTVTARPMTDGELARAVELHALAAGIWNRAETDKDEPLPNDVIEGVRLVDLSARAGGQAYELIDVDGCATGLYSALRTPGWDKWTGRSRSTVQPFSFRRAMLELGDATEGWWLLDPVARTAALWRQAVRKAGH